MISSLALLVFVPFHFPLSFFPCGRQRKDALLLHVYSACEQCDQLREGGGSVLSAVFAPQIHHVSPKKLVEKLPTSFYTNLVVFLLKCFGLKNTPSAI